MIDEFTTNQTITLVLKQNGEAEVSQQIDITNNLSQIYPQEYTISFSGTTAKINSPTQNPDFQIASTKQVGDKTEINLKLLQPGIGKGQHSRFNLDYTLFDFVKTKGKTREISLPNFQTSTNQSETKYVIISPVSFGEPASTSPISSLHNLGESNRIELSSNSEIGRRTLLTFGNHQLVDFKLKYYLKNESEVSTKTEIAIPPDTNEQSIIFSEMSPQPLNIKADNDGNWLASYTIPPKEKISVLISGQAKIFPSKYRQINISPNDYLKSQPFWQTTDSRLTSIAQSLGQPKTIYDYVVKNLTYDYSQINSSSRKGAIYALDNPQNSLCTEFSDLFVALCRSAGIPAREIEGFALGTNEKTKPLNPNSDILHAWAQYYDTKKMAWISVDPTWEKTTNGIDYFQDTDLNHLTFVIHGQDSSYPPPPGAYKSNENIKTVDVSYATKEISRATLPISLSQQSNQLNIYNPNPHSLNQVQISLPLTKWTTKINILPPHSHQTLTFKTPNFFISALPQQKQLNFLYTSHESLETINIKTFNQSHYFNLTLIIGFIIVCLCISGIILTRPQKK